MSRVPIWVGAHSETANKGKKPFRNLRMQIRSGHRYITSKGGTCPGTPGRMITLRMSCLLTSGLRISLSLWNPCVRIDSINQKHAYMYVYMYWGKVTWFFDGVRRSDTLRSVIGAIKATLEFDCSLCFGFGFAFGLALALALAFHKVYKNLSNHTKATPRRQRGSSSSSQT